MTDISRLSRPVVPPTASTPATVESKPVAAAAPAAAAAPTDALVGARAGRNVADAGRSAGETHLASQSAVHGGPQAEAVKVSPEVAALGKKYDLGAAQYSDKYGVSFERGYVGLEKGKVVSINVPFQHTVKPGDTLTKIAKKFETDVTFLAEINGIKDPNKIQVGQKLDVGLSGQVIMPGDTLSKYANQTGVSVEDIARLNGIKDPNKIKAGDVIGLPWMGC